MKHCAIYCSLILFVLTLFIVPSLLYGSSEFDKWKSEEMGRFRDFKEKRDKDFTAYLKKQWEEFKVFAGEKAYEKPKYPEIPVAPRIKPDEAKPFGGKAAKVIPLPKAPPKPPVADERVQPPVPEPPPVSLPESKAVPGVKRINFNFYGSPVALTYDESMKLSPLRSVDSKAISHFWEQQSKTDYDILLRELKNYRESLSLNDWGYHLLVYKTGEKIFGSRHRNNVNLFAWFILSKSGYESKIGYNSNEIFLLIPSKNSLYGVSFLNINGKKYYALSFDNKTVKMNSIYTYRANYPGSDELMDYGIYKTPEILKKVKKKELQFNYRGKTYKVPVEYNESVANFFEYYPQTEFEVYFNASVSPEAGYSMLKGLRPIIKGQTEGEAVNMIMRFVQSAFKYKTDKGQFGREKYLLPDETLYYPYSDCEDRSILFAYLVRNLLDLEVIGLHYPGHMATAVSFRGDMRGDAITYRGKRYIVCDPTYINADVGMAMPEYKSVRPRVIPVGI